MYDVCKSEDVLACCPPHAICSCVEQLDPRVGMLHTSTARMQAHAHTMRRTHAPRAHASTCTPHVPAVPQHYINHKAEYKKEEEHHAFKNKQGLDAAGISKLLARARRQRWGAVTRVPQATGHKSATASQAARVQP